MTRMLLGWIVLAVLAGCESGPRQVLPYVQADGLGGLDLYLYDLESGGSTALKRTPGVDEMDPSVDYPGQRVAYVTRQAGGEGVTYVLSIYDLQTGQTDALMLSDEPLSSPVWSNRGKQLAYVVERGGKLLIEVKTLATDAPATAIGFGSDPSWRMDDKAIFFNSRDTRGADSGDLTVHDLKTGLNQSLRLRGNGFRNLPKGTSVLYTTLPYSRRNEAVWMIDANSRQQRLSSPGKTHRDTDPVHINGTKFVAFTRTDVATDKSSIYVVERYATDPVETLLFEAKGSAYTRGGSE